MRGPRCVFENELDDSRFLLFLANFSLASLKKVSSWKNFGREKPYFNSGELSWFLLILTENENEIKFSL